MFQLLASVYSFFKVFKSLYDWYYRMNQKCFYVIGFVCLIGIILGYQKLYGLVGLFVDNCKTF